MAIGIWPNLDKDLLQSFKWGQLTMDWVIHKTLWEEGSEQALRMEALQRGWDSFLGTFIQMC